MLCQGPEIAGDLPGKSRRTRYNQVVTSKQSALTEWLWIARYHIVIVAMTAALVFGWLMSGRYLWGLSLVVGLDWFLINLLNRITDVAEDTHNQVPGTARVAAQKRGLLGLSLGLLVGSFVTTHVIWPQLTVWRVVVQLIGLAYNYKVVPTPSGLSRLKEMYFFKNFGSSVLFVLTCFVYPLETAGHARLSGPAIATLAVFFVLFETTYEILYDFRDLEGDKLLAVPTYPVVHGPRRAEQILIGLLGAAALTLGLGVATGTLGVRELLMGAAPLSQLVFYRPRLRRGLTSADCLWLTHLGSAQLVLFLVGTAIWQAAGLPDNIYLRERDGRASVGRNDVATK